MKTIKQSIILMFFSIQTAYCQVSNGVLNLSLEQCVEYATTNNISVRLSELEAEKSEWEKKEMRSAGLPQISSVNSLENYLRLPVLIVPGEIFGQPEGNIPVEFGTKYSVNTSLQASQMILNLSYFTSRKIAKQIVELSQFQIEDAKEKISIEIANLYFYILATKNHIEILKSNCKNLEKLYQLSKLQFDNGLCKEVDLRKIEVEWNNVKSQKNNLESHFKNQITTMLFLLDIPITEEIEFTDSIQIPIVQYEFADRLSTHPEVKIWNTKESISELTVHANKAQIVPAVSAFASYSFQAQRDKMDMFSKGGEKWFEVGVIGVSLNIPIFTGFERKAQIQKSIIELEQIRQQKENRLTYFKNEFLKAACKMKDYAENLSVQKENMALANRVYGLTENSYKQGLSSLTDVILAQNNVLKARLQHLQSLLNIRLAEIELIQSSGNIHFLSN